MLIKPCDVDDAMMAAMHRLMAKIEPTLPKAEAVCTPHDHVLTDRECYLNPTTIMFIFSVTWAEVHRFTK